MTSDLFYQKHSDTSREAAELNTSAGAQRERVFNFIKSCNTYGSTTDEVKNYLLRHKLIHKNSVMSARVRELELAGRIVKTTMKRKTSAGRNANVYVTKEIFINAGLERDVKKDSTDLQKLNEENANLRRGISDILKVSVELGGFNIVPGSQAFNSLKSLIEKENYNANL